MSGKKTRVLIGILILGSILAALKTIFVDYTLDEEYQVVMAYRRLSGDTLFGTMWEPHQTSAFACVWLMWLFRAVTGTLTGVVLFLRLCTTLIQLALTVWIYRVLRRGVSGEYALILALTWFNISPKLIMVPDFSNLQVWGLTAAVLALAELRMRQNGGALWAVICGLGMSASVLAYPSGVVLFPVFLVMLYRGNKQVPRRSRIRLCMLYTAVCAVCAALWLAVILRSVTWDEFLRNVRYMIDFDATHDMSVTAAYRIAALLRDARTLVILLAVILVIAAAGWGMTAGILRRRGVRTGLPDRVTAAVYLVLASVPVQLYYWLVLHKGYEEPQIHLVLILIAAGILWRESDKKLRGSLFPAILTGVLTVAVVLYTSDLGLWYAVPHGVTGVLAALLVLVSALTGSGENAHRGETLTIGFRRGLARTLLFVIAFTTLFGKGFTLRAGKTETNTVLGIGGIIREGPAAGILTNYMQGYITNSTYEEFQEIVPEGSSCLIVTNLLGTAGTSPYLFTDAEVCHFSVVDPTSYDERLLTYWELYPEKAPDIIVVDCWYGELKESEDSWIMEYIENEFGYTSVIDGKYVRYYFR